MGHDMKWVNTNSQIKPYHRKDKTVVLTKYHVHYLEPEDVVYKFDTWNFENS